MFYIYPLGLMQDIIIYTKGNSGKKEEVLNDLTGISSGYQLDVSKMKRR